MRFINSIKNFVVGIGGNILTILLGFFSRYFFLLLLSVEYLGVSGLFSSILTMLSFAELGVGTAIVYSLYKPLAIKDNEAILSIMQFFKKVYRIIGCVVFIVGLCFLPFLDFFVTDRKGIENLELIYVLFLLNTAISYFFTYNRSLITADQKAYKLAAIDYLYKIGHVVIPLLVLWATRSYIIYLAIQITTTFLWNFIVYIKVQKEYPILQDRKKHRISGRVKKEITKNTTALMIYKIAIVVTAGTDNLLITRFFGLTTVGLCSNYTLIIQNMTSLVSQGISSITASIGNLSAVENDEKKYQIFNIVFLVNFWIYAFASLGLFFCINPLIHVCFGEKYVLGNSILIPMIVSFFLLGMQGTTSVFREAQGLFWQGKLRPIAQTIINLGSSAILAKLTGEVGMIFWGTAISRIATNFWYDPYIVFKHGLHKPLVPYFKRYFIYVVAVIPPLVICHLLFEMIFVDSHLLDLLLKTVITTVVVNLCLFLSLSRTKEFKYLRSNLYRALKSRNK